eukprot:4160930-Ditylum_brightwellii.AAC.1
MMHMVDVPGLRNRLFIVQQQISAYHNISEEIEKLKAHNKHLECQASYFLEGKSSHMMRVHSLENEIVGSKMKLAQSKEKVDSHNFNMQTVISEMKILEETAKALRCRSLRPESLFRRLAIKDALW